MRIQHLLFKPLVIEKCDDGDMVRVSLCVTVRPVWGRAAAVEIQIWCCTHPGPGIITSTLFLTLHFTCLSFRALPALTLSVRVSDPPISAQYQPGINQSQARRTECLQNYQRSLQHLFCIADGGTSEKCPFNSQRHAYD